MISRIKNATTHLSFMTLAWVVFIALSAPFLSSVLGLSNGGSDLGTGTASMGLNQRIINKTFADRDRLLAADMIIIGDAEFIKAFDMGEARKRTPGAQILPIQLNTIELRVVRTVFRGLFECKAKPKQVFIQNSIWMWQGIARENLEKVDIGKLCKGKKPTSSPKSMKKILFSWRQGMVDFFQIPQQLIVRVRLGSRKVLAAPDGKYFGISNFNKTFGDKKWFAKMPTEKIWITDNRRVTLLTESRFELPIEGFRADFISGSNIDLMGRICDLNDLNCIFKSN